MSGRVGKLLLFFLLSLPLTAVFPAEYQESEDIAAKSAEEATLGIHAGHDEAKALVDASLSNFEARGEADLDEMEAVVGAISSTD